MQLRSAPRPDSCDYAASRKRKQLGLGVYPYLSGILRKTATPNNTERTLGCPGISRCRSIPHDRFFLAADGLQAHEESKAEKNWALVLLPIPLYNNPLNRKRKTHHLLFNFQHRQKCEKGRGRLGSRAMLEQLKRPWERH